MGHSSLGYPGVGPELVDLREEEPEAGDEVSEEEGQARHHQNPLHASFDAETREAFAEGRATHDANTLEDAEEAVEAGETSETKQLIVGLSAFSGKLNELEGEGREQVNEEPALDVVERTASAAHYDLASLLLLPEASEEVEHNVGHEEAVHDAVDDHPPQRRAVFKGHSVRKRERSVDEQQPHHHVPASSE